VNQFQHKNIHSTD